VVSQQNRDQAEGYARFYAPLAVVSVVISFLPLLEDGYGTLWEMAGRPGGGPAVIGVLLMVALIALLGFAAFKPVAKPGIPFAIAGVAALIVVMLLTKPGTGTPTPGLTPSGDAAVAITVCAAALGFFHALHLRRRRSLRTRPVR
jgi:hypothetical protein